MRVSVLARTALFEGHFLTLRSFPLSTCSTLLVHYVDFCVGMQGSLSRVISSLFPLHTHTHTHRHNTQHTQHTTHTHKHTHTHNAQHTTHTDTHTQLTHTILPIFPFLHTGLVLEGHSLPLPSPSDQHVHPRHGLVRRHHGQTEMVSERVGLLIRVSTKASWSSWSGE